MRTLEEDMAEWDKLDAEIEKATASYRRMNEMLLDMINRVERIRGGHVENERWT